MTDWEALYREHVSDVSALAGDLTDDQLSTTVPATPAWTVRDVLAHMAGVPSDIATGRMDGAPSPEWTARHVGERRHLPVGELVSELQAHQDAVVETLADNDSPAVVFDITVHHADLHEALGKPPLPEHLWRPVLDVVGARVHPSLAESVPPYELFRGLFSRRSRGQMSSWQPDLEQAVLDELCIFGPRDDDQPVPA